MECATISVWHRHMWTLFISTVVHADMKVYETINSLSHASYMQKHTCAIPTNNVHSHVPVPHWNCGTLCLEKPLIFQSILTKWYWKRMHKRFKSTDMFRLKDLTWWQRKCDMFLVMKIPTFHWQPQISMKSMICLWNFMWILAWLSDLSV